MTSPPETTPLTDAAAAGSGPVGTLASISVDCPDPSRLAAFYGTLLGLQRVFASEDESIIALSNGTIALTLMRVDDHVAPTWPGAGQAQQMHLDVSVVDLEQAVASATALGARQAGHQPAPEVWRVLLDPAGHPFCLTTVTAG